MELQTIIYEAKNQIAWVTLNRPEVMNAINHQMAGEIVSACRLAEEDNEVRHGIMPGSGGTQRLARIVGLAKALEICLTGELVDAKEAYRIGLVHRLVPPGELLDVGERLAVSMMKGAPLSLRFTKEAIYVGSELPIEQGLRLEADLSALVATTEDSKEGPRAFVEQRAPVWKGK